MNLETFFEKFELFADAPDAVAKMRELVLQLAIQGGLVDQRPEDAVLSYSVIEDALPINTDHLPPKWRVVLLSDAIKNRSGNSKLIKGKLYEDPAPGRFQGFSASGPDVWCENYEHESQAIIISAVGARCGKAFKASGKWCAIANTNIAFPDPKLLDFDFAFLVLNNEHFWVRGGSAQPFVKFPPSLDRHFALPPLAEQKRIVAKVDELMALCDRLEAQQQEREAQASQLARASLARFAEAPTPANLPFLFHSSFSIPPSDLRKSILTLAVQGKLVPQDPNDEPAEKLLVRILTDNPRLRDSFKEPTEQATTPEELTIMPESWVQVALGRVMKVTSSKRIFESEYADTGVPFFRSKEIGDLSRGEPIKTTLYISAVRYSELQQHPDCPKPGDLLLTSVGTIGNTWIVDDREFYFKDGNITQIIRTDGIEMRYVQLYIASPVFTDAVGRTIAGTAYNALTIIKIKALTFPLPPLAEQRRIVAKVEQLMALVDALETQLAASRDTAANLLAAIVAELTGTPHNGKVSLPATSRGRGRPPQS